MAPGSHIIMKIPGRNPCHVAGNIKAGSWLWHHSCQPIEIHVRKILSFNQQVSFTAVDSITREKNRIYYGMMVVSVGLPITPYHYAELSECVVYITLVLYIMSCVCLRLGLLSQSPSMLAMGPCVICLPISLLIIFIIMYLFLDSKVLMVPTWGPSGAGRTQVGPMLAQLTLLSGLSLSSWNGRDIYRCRMCIDTVAIVLN